MKYVGNITSELLKIEKVKLPTITFLHGLEDEDSKKSFIEIELVTNKIEVEIRSNLTSHLYKKSENLLKFYKRQKESFPIVFEVVKNGVVEEIKVKLSWDNIKIRKLEDGNFGNLFELNLSEVSVK